MLSRLTKIAAGRILIIISGLMLAAAGVTALSAGPAHASTPSVISYWGNTGVATDGTIYDCGTTWLWQQGSSAVNEVYNPCNARVWVHYVDDGDPSLSGTYCVNPDGLAYDIPLQWNKNDQTNIQLTSNTSLCDSTVGVTWEANLQFAGKTYDCQPGGSYTVADFTVDGLANDCDSRIWLHGPGNSSDCIEPTSGTFYDEGSQYTEVQTTAVQAPCSAVQPYPY
jgi:hypothetical protein